MAAEPLEWTGRAMSAAVPVEIDPIKCTCSPIIQGLGLPIEVPGGEIDRLIQHRPWRCFASDSFPRRRRPFSNMFNGRRDPLRPSSPLAVLMRCVYCVGG